MFLRDFILKWYIIFKFFLIFELIIVSIIMIIKFMHILVSLKNFFLKVAVTHYQTKLISIIASLRVVSFRAFFNSFYINLKVVYFIYIFKL